MAFGTLPETFFAGGILLVVTFALTGVPLVVTLADVFVFDLADVFVFDEELPEEPLTYLEFMSPPLLFTTLELPVLEVLGALDAASLADLVLSSEALAANLAAFFSFSFVPF